MGLSVSTATAPTISGVGVAHPGTISSVGVANPGKITGVDIAHPGVLGGVGAVPGVTTPVPTVAPYVPPAAPAPVYAPKLDIAAVNAQARADANNAVNPYYTATLNKYLADAAAKQEQQEQQTKTNIQNAQDTLKQVTDANALTGERATTDTATKEGQINQGQDQFQQDSGTSFENARLAQARLQATAGTLGSGAGNRETNTAIVSRNTTEGRSVDAAQQQKDAAELFKARTFEDLGNSTKLATTAEGKTESQANFDLSNYIQNLNHQTDITRDQLDKQRQAEIAATTKSLAQTAYANYINGIADPARKVAAAQTYGGVF